MARFPAPSTELSDPFATLRAAGGSRCFPPSPESGAWRDLRGSRAVSEARTALTAIHASVRFEWMNHFANAPADYDPMGGVPAHDATRYAGQKYRHNVPATKAV